jgi:hypothetical protein
MEEYFSTDLIENICSTPILHAERCTVWSETFALHRSSRRKVYSLVGNISSAPIRGPLAHIFAGCNARQQWLIPAQARLTK